MSLPLRRFHYNPCFTMGLYFHRSLAVNAKLFRLMHLSLSKALISPQHPISTWLVLLSASLTLRGRIYILVMNNTESI